MSKKQLEEEQKTVESLKRLSDGLGLALSKEQIEAVFALSLQGANPEGIAVALKACEDSKQDKQRAN